MKSVHLQRTSEQGIERTKEHSHDYYELVVILHGEGYHWLAGRQISLRRGQVYLVPPGRRHYFSDFQKIVLQNIMFSREALKYLGRVLKCLPDVQAIISNPPVAPIVTLESTAISELDMVQNRIALESHQGGNSNLMLLFSCLMQVLGIVFNPEERKNDISLYGNGDITATLDYMRRNYVNDISIANLAAIAHMSVCSFLHHFKQEFHITPGRWLMFFRLRHAMVFLMRPELSVGEVAINCGFKDPMYFSRQFRKYLGCTPSQYRLYGQGRIQIDNGIQQFTDESFLMSDVMDRSGI